MTLRRDYSFTRRPRWLVGHVVALLAIVLFVALGFWQLRRHDDRGATNSQIQAGMTAAVESLPVMVASAEGRFETLEYRRGSVTGRYATSDEVILRARSLNGQSGHHVLTPLVLADGTAVIVDRGWVPIDATGPPVEEALPPEGEVRVMGFVRLTQIRGRFGPTDPPTGRLDRIARVDLARLAQQLTYPVVPVFLQLTEQQPPQASRLPLVLPAPEIDAGPHLSYAVQWFVFAGVVLVSYPILLWRTALGPRRDRR